MKDKNSATTSLLKRILVSCSVQVCFYLLFYVRLLDIERDYSGFPFL